MQFAAAEADLGKVEVALQIGAHALLAIGALGTLTAVYVHNIFENLHVLNLGIQLSVSWALVVAAHHRWTTLEAARWTGRVEYSRR